MSIESEIQMLTAAIKALTDAVISSAAPVVEKPVKAPKAVAAPVVAEVVAAPVVAPVVAAPVITAPVAAAMPAPPSFLPPTVPAASVGVPFSDGKSLIEWTMKMYRELGTNGAKIQDVLLSLGMSNINDLPADKYAAFHNGVMALKG